MKLNKRVFWTIIKSIITIYCFMMYLLNNNEYIFFVLPLLYTIMTGICKNDRKFWGICPGYTVLNIVMTIRYILVPLVLCSTNKLSIYAKNYNYINVSIAYMLYEMIAIFVTLKLTEHKFFNRIKSECKKIKVVNIKPSMLISTVIIVIIVSILIFNSNLLGGISLVFEGSVDNEQINIMEETSTFIKIIWQCLTTWIFVYFINRQKSEDKGKKEKIMMSIIYLLLFVFVTYIGQTRISRWYFLVSAIAGIFTLTSLFPGKRKKIYTIVGIPIFILLISASIFKSGVRAEEILQRSSIFKLITPTTVDSYFAGPVSINNAIGLKNTKEINIYNGMFDIFNNMPIVNHFIEKEKTTVYLYNEYLDRVFNNTSGDQIIPLIGQSMIFFSGVFAPVLSIISVLIIRFLDQKFILSNHYYKYIWAFSSIWFGLETILNMTINLSWIYIRIIPLFITFYIISIFSSKELEDEEKDEREIKNI